MRQRYIKTHHDLSPPTHPYRLCTQLRAADVAKVVAQKWKDIDDTERQYWIDMSNRDRDRFEREKACYRGPWKVLDVKDSDAPKKKPMLEFLDFANDRRGAVAEANPSLSNVEMSHILSEKWQGCPSTIKKHYKDREILEQEGFKAARYQWEKHKSESKSTQGSPSTGTSEASAPVFSNDLLSFLMSHMQEPLLEPLDGITPPTIQLLKPGEFSTHAYPFSYQSHSCIPSSAEFPMQAVAPSDALLTEALARTVVSDISDDEALDELDLLSEMDLDQIIPEPLPSASIPGILGGAPDISIGFGASSYSIISESTLLGEGCDTNTITAATAASAESVEAHRLSVLAQQLGDTGVKLLIGAFR